MTMGSGNAGSRRAWVSALAAASLWLILLGGASAGTISVGWNAAAATDVVAYRVYYGPAPGDHSNMQSVAAPTIATDLTGVPDCTLQYIVIRAYDGSLEGPADSNAVRGFPRPAVTGVTPTSIRQGETKTFTVAGVNFDAGVSGDATRPAARIRLTGAGLAVTSTAVNACGQITVTIQAGAAATVGFTGLGVENPDLSYTDPAAHPWVFGVLNNALEVQAGDAAAPTVKSATPADGATGVAATVQPTVTFSESVDPSSVTLASVSLLDDTGFPMAQAAGWPAVSGAVVTLQPAQSLTAGKTYRIRVKGGAGGVTDLAGNPLGADWVQTTGFAILADNRSPSATDLAVNAATPAAGQSGVSRTLREVRITFNHDVSALWSALTQTELRDMFRVTRNGSALRQAYGSPVTADSGQTVVITLQEALQLGMPYRTEAGPASARAQTALTSAGLGAGVLIAGWRTDPPWMVESPLTDVLYRTGATTPLVRLTIPTTTGVVPQENTNLPLTPQFVLRFKNAVSARTLSPSMFQIIKSNGKAVALSGRPSLEQNGLLVVFKLAAPLNAGGLYRISVRPGGGAPTVVVPFATAVDSGTQSGTLGVAP